MRHALLYTGSFETNFATLRPGVTTFTGSDGSEHPIEWPTAADGIRVSFMEKPAKHFVAVRIQHGEDDIVLEHPVLLDPARHLEGRRFRPDPMEMADNIARLILEEAIRKNESQRHELSDIRMRLSHSVPPPA